MESTGETSEVDDGTVVPELAAAVNFNWLPNADCKTILEIERDYRWYQGASDGDGGPPV